MDLLNLHLNIAKMSKFFYGIQDLFENVLFAPLHFFRFIGNWWTENSINWIFVVIGMIAFVYWMGQLKIFHKEGDEDMSSTSHSYL